MIEEDKINYFIMTHMRYFPEDKLHYIREELMRISPEKYSLLLSIEFHDPTTLLLTSIFLGSLGVDRFLLGNTALGVLKLLTFGCCGIFTLIDWFLITQKTKETNFIKFMSVV